MTYQWPVAENDPSSLYRRMVQALWEASNTLGLATHFIPTRERRMGEAATPREMVDSTLELIHDVLRLADPDCRG